MLERALGADTAALGVVPHSTVMVQPILDAAPRAEVIAGSVAGLSTSAR